MVASVSRPSSLAPQPLCSLPLRRLHLLGNYLVFAVCARLHAERISLFEVGLPAVREHQQPVTVGPLIADVPIAITLVFVISQVPADFLRFVKFAGAALLVYLAWGLWRELRRKQATAAGNAHRPQSPFRGLLQGVLMLFLSPGPYLFWALVLGPLLLEALNLSMGHALVFLAGFYGFSIGGLLLIAFILGRIGQLSPTGKRAFQMGSLLLMLVIAATLIENGLRT